MPREVRHPAKSFADPNVSDGRTRDTVHHHPAPGANREARDPAKVSVLVAKTPLDRLPIADLGHVHPGQFAADFAAASVHASAISV
jgi:hypothetical protein